MSDSLGSPSAQAKQWGMFCHLSALIGICLPFGNIIAPAVLWKVKGGEDPFIEDQGKEAVNFQICLTLVSLALVVLSIIIGFIPVIRMLSALISLVSIVVGLGGLALLIMGGLKANAGERYRYPFIIRLIK